VQPLSSRWTVRLRFGRIFTEVENCWKERGYCRGSRQGSSRDRRGSRRRKTKEAAAAKQVNSRSSRRSVDRPGRPPAVAGDRSTGPVDRRAQRAQGWSSVDRPVDRLKVPNSLLGTRSTDRSTGGRGRSTARSTDKRVRAAIAGLETCCI